MSAPQPTPPPAVIHVHHNGAGWIAKSPGIQHQTMVWHFPWAAAADYRKRIFPGPTEMTLIRKTRQRATYRVDTMKMP